MKKLLLFVGLSFCTGCTNFNKMIGLNSSGTPNLQNHYFVGAGQSNMANENLGQTFANSTNVAFGGTSIEQWQKNYKWGQKSWETGPQLYSQLLTHLKGHPNAIILFWQGETEGLQCTDADQWSFKFIRMVRDLRQDVGYQVPVLYVQIGNTNLPHPCWNEVQDQQAQAIHLLPNLLMISAKDLSPQGDGLIHYAQDQYKEMQSRMLGALEAGE